MKDVVIKFLTVRHIKAVKRYLQEQGRDQFEKGDIPPDVNYDLPTILEEALSGSKGADYPCIDSMSMR